MHLANLHKLVVPVRKCPSGLQEEVKHFNMSKADIRTACRKRWGKEWYKVHPVIKKAHLLSQLEEAKREGFAGCGP